MMEPFSAQRIRRALDTTFLGQNLVYLPEAGSTNDEARRLAQDGAPEGTLVLTDHQTSGRGRLDRRWEAPPGSSLLMSVVFRPPLAPHEVQRLTMVCGLAVIDAIESETGLQVGLKWPNDVVVGPAKVAGILTEIGAQGSKVNFAVVGLGLNVNLNPAGLPDGLLVPATSLSHELKRPVARLPLLVALLQAMETRYTALKAGRSPHLEWTGRLVTLGRPVTVSTTGASLEGVAEGVNADGALLVRLDSGRLETVMAGDVTLRTRGRSGHT
jgi:BirA family biotin operon repressor/biotin-[acetyl-CoA-carboxylase] ligase